MCQPGLLCVSMRSTWRANLDDLVCQLVVPTWRNWLVWFVMRAGAMLRPIAFGAVRLLLAGLLQGRLPDRIRS